MSRDECHTKFQNGDGNFEPLVQHAAPSDNGAVTAETHPIPPLFSIFPFLLVVEEESQKLTFPPSLAFALCFCTSILVRR